MKAMVVRELGGGWSEEEVKLADPLSNEVVVKIKASGLCGSDLMEMRNKVKYPPPAVLGHEITGVVMAVGTNVTTLDIGDHVAGCLVQFCGKCDRCLAGEPGLCRNPDDVIRGSNEEPRLTDAQGKPLNQGMGLGGFAQKALVHENMLVKIPKSMPFPQAALLGCGVITGTGAVLNAAQVTPGSTVVIIGAGGVGLNATSGAVIAGANRIISIDIDDKTLESARKFGATHVINSTMVDSVTEVKKLTGGAGVSYVFDFVGLSTTATQGYEMLDRGGVLYQIGMAGSDASLKIPNLSNVFDRKGVQGVFMGSGVPPRDIPMLAGQYLNNRLNLDDLVSAEIALSQINEGYELLKDPQINRVVITNFE